ncbi:hypothetical protein BC830DRAFT_236116 [Chytriomyces sp. MP71]|nr:hypothetical protein BC830DRAFT_236116 [Chytriomyces sp. MP71]
MWAKATGEINSLYNFRHEIHRLLGVRESPGSLAGCQEILNRLKERKDGGLVGSFNRSEMESLHRFKVEVYDALNVDADGCTERECVELVNKLRSTSNSTTKGQFHDVDEDLKLLEAFADKVHRELGIQRGTSSLDFCLQSISNFVRQIGEHETYAQIVKHFMELFEIQAIHDVPSAINELYVNHAERNV